MKEDDELAINIVLDNTNPSSPVFVEIENDKGMSINIGKQSARDDGFWNIRITSNDIIFHKDT